MFLRRQQNTIALSLFILIILMCLWMNYTLFLEQSAFIRVQSLTSFFAYISAEIEIIRPSTSAIGVIMANYTSHYTAHANKSSLTLECPGLLPPIKIRDEQTWLPIDNSARMYVFSAFHDDINRKPYIRLIGLSEGEKNIIFCQIWFMDKTNMSHSDKYRLEIVRGSITTIANQGSKRYQEVYYLCPLANDEIPTAVSVVAAKCQKPYNIIYVMPRSQQVKTKRNFTICLSPLNFNYSRVYELVEWLELNGILGADFFAIYNYSSASNVRKVLNMYSDRRLVDVIQWPLPMAVDTWPESNIKSEITYFGQTAALNDCLYRSRPNTKFLINIDLDEFIIPRSNGSYSWWDMMKMLPKANGYLFLNTFFRKDWPDYRSSGKELLVDPGYISDVESYNLITLKKLQREDLILPKGQRSKYMVNPEEAISIRIHDIWKYRNKQETIGVDPNIGLLHHYRNWFNPGVGTRVVDTRLLIYQDELVRRVRRIWSKLNGVPLDRY
ncbi:hypothetical protein ACJMK2_010295 [Sinanodonta woodiana]|uniref:Glycosyltransferase family 92 protein n=1 Tax=Sinanodonta woodiana TaxID=1069815 RepID=A0ABD3VF82_SINWO